MSHEEYMNILSKIEIDLRKVDTQFRKTISPTEKLLSAYGKQNPKFLYFRVFCKMFSCNQSITRIHN